MQFSKNWIGEYVDLPEFAEEVAHRLTAAGHAVDTIETVETATGADHLLEVEVTTNRPDCMCHLGLAREVAAILGRELKVPDGEGLQPVADAADAVATLSVDDHALCPSFTLQVIRGVQVGPSPDWLVARLEAIGSRSINNIVDITNYVLWETGQPLHAYDLRKLATDGDGRHVVRVRRATEGETLKTLDGEKRKLDPSILVIADAEAAIGLGGIMGGFDSEVTESTVDILLEAGHFDPSTVRHGAKTLALKTDAGHRFERGADPKACYWAARRAAAMIVELAGGELLDGHLEATDLRADWPPTVEISLAKLQSFGGVTLGAKRVETILEALGFTVQHREDGDDTLFTVTAPSWRYYDFEDAHAQDVYEEVLRIYGFDPIPSTLPIARGTDAPMRPQHRRRRATQDTLASCGFAEAITFAFLDRESDAAYPSFYADREAMALANPLSDLYTVMRRSLLPNLVATARYNQRRGAEAVRVFEIGHIFGAAPEHEEGRVEMDVLALVAGGRLGTPWEHQVELDFFDLKGTLEVLAQALGHRFTFRAAERPNLVAGTTAEILRVDAGDGEQVVGFIGQLDEHDLAYPLFVAELSLDRLGEGTISLETRTPSRYPGIDVDLTLTHSLDVPWRDVAAAVEGAAVDDLVQFSLVDRYQGEGVPFGAVNTTIAFRYNAPDRSLTQDEINSRHEAVRSLLTERFGFGGAS
ncbi:MAG: phenylalanine--tRNA ligase subunit beta [Acidobacteriota bacterium]